MNKYQHKIEVAINWLRSGRVIAYPTESVYGLGCNPNNLIAVQALLAIKQRSASKGLILVASNLKQILSYIHNPSEQMINRINTSSEDVVTWLVPAKKTVSPLLTGNHKTIAIRLSKHPIIFQLCKQLGHPIVSTSANKTGEEALWTAAEVKQKFKSELAYVLDAPSGNRLKPSEIRDILTDQVIRA